MEEYKKEYMRKYRIKNRGKIRKKRKDYNKKNHNKILQKAKEYRIKNKEKILEYKKKYKKKPDYKSKRSMWNKTYRIKNKEKIYLQQQKYNLIPENKLKSKIYNKKYHSIQENKFKRRLRYRRPENKLKSKIYNKKYYSNPEIRDRVNKNKRKRFNEDIQFHIRETLRTRLRGYFNNYCKGKKPKKCTDNYINYSLICEHLMKTLPEDFYSKKYHIDHIKPLCSFNLEDLEELKKATLPENHGWLLASQNLSKGGHYNV